MAVIYLIALIVILMAGAFVAYRSRHDALLSSGWAVLYTGVACPSAARLLPSAQSVLLLVGVVCMLIGWLMVRRARARCAGPSA
ncbi:hypothetical protein R0381_000994 [Jeongeupia wiesaeckerbachi]|uniref:hypothetical protein n=1 Tax=Jeongeupia wiesaeckerbachi TaxID=3051218 RepID=UPI003D805B2C